MHKSRFQKQSSFLLSFLLTFLTGSVHADDTEIFFSGASSAAVRPNVLLILDTSGSMDTSVSGTGKTRIQIMKEALVSIIEGMEDVNVGLMRFTYQEGGPVLFPIKYIDANAGETVSEPDDTKPAFNYNVTTGNNDGEQEDAAAGAVNLTNPVLRIGVIPAGGGSGSVDLRVSAINDAAFEEDGRVDDDQELELHWKDDEPSDGNGADDNGHFGVRFTGVNIPQGATITAAHIELTVQSQESSSTAQIDIRTQQVDNATAFAGGNTSDISTRFSGGSEVSNWSPPNSSSGTTLSTPDLSAIVQDIVSRGGWTSGNSMAFIFQNDVNVRRDYHSYGSTNNASQRPRLVVSYTGAATPAQNQVVALHFPTVDIPKDAPILSATLTFTASSSASGATSWTIQADNTDSSAALAASNGNFNSPTRDLTGPTTTWDAASSPALTDFVAETAYTTVDFSNVVQGIVDRANWCGGNAMTILIDADSGLRNVYSYDGSSTKAPVLNVSYDATSPGLGCVQKTETAQISSDTDDAEQNGSSMDRTSGDLDLGEKIVGVRFQGVDVPKDATILSAFIDFTADGTNTSGAGPTVNIVGQAHDNAPAFSSSNNDLSGRTATTANVNWALDAVSPAANSGPSGADGPWDADDEVHTTPDLKTIVQEIVNRSNWASGNNMVFRFSDVGSTTREAQSRDDSGTQAPRLRISYQSTGASATAKTVRQRLIEIVEGLPSNDYTPIVEVLYEAAHYWKGDKVVYGKGRDDRSDTIISHPGSYCDGPGDCNGATVNGSSPVTDEFGVFYPSGCSASNLNSFSCRTQAIIGNPDYISPFNEQYTCASNYQVLLTDGLANSSEAQGDIRDEFDISSCQSTKSFDLNGDGDTNDTGESASLEEDEECGIDLVRNQFTVDQSDSIDGDQTVTTYTVGFNTSSLAGADLYLQSMAEAGGGQWFAASVASDLVNVFEQILTAVKDDPTAFVAPTIATNQFNQLLSRDQVYFGMFTPDLQKSWLGNLKKYQLCLDTDPNNDGTPDCTFAEVLDGQTPPQPAIDPADDQFKTSAQSFWSSVPDGRQTTKGGAGAQLDDYTTRVIYTNFRDDGSGGIENATSGTSLNGTGYKLTSANWSDALLAQMREEVCGGDFTDTGTTAGLDCQSRMLFMLGKIFEVEDTDPSASTRWAINDVLHSAPVVITYGGADNFDANGDPGTDGIIDTFFDKVLFGSNDGGLHMVNGETGIEEWVFIPQDMMSIQPTLYSNAEGNHVYGLDLPPTLRIIDNNNNGKVEPANGDKVYIYIGMRRGGNMIYALDITPAATITSNSTTIVPKFLWQIEGGTGDFTRMGQSWSQPVVAKIRTTTGSKDVLVFGGGYDVNMDDPAKFATDSTDNGVDDFLGNAIYVVDATTGAMLLTISGSNSGADITDANMQYSIPSTLTVFDNDGDGFEDRIYAADTGGQVWRVDLGTDVIATGGLDSTATNKTIVGRLAAIADNSAAADPVDQRRFFNRPAVVQVRDNIYSDAAGGEFDYVIVGSGYRAHPLDESVNDRLYAFRDRTIGKMAGQSGVGNVQHLADGYPAKSGGITAGPISHADSDDLLDITTTPLNDVSRDVTQTRQSSGWYFDFETDTTATEGEKVLASARVIAGTAFITSFQPTGVSSNPCAANIGVSRLGNFNILTGAAAIDWDGDGDIDADDLFKEGGAGIVSEGVPVYTEHGVLIVHTVGAGITAEEATPGVPRFRTYWHDDV